MTINEGSLDSEFNKGFEKCKKELIKRFEKEAKEKYKRMEKFGLKVTCLCNRPKWHLMNFNLDEIRKIINEESRGYGYEKIKEGLKKLNKYGRTY